MEIAYFFKDYKVPMYQWQHVHIIDELKSHNCNVNIINPLEYASVEEANDALLKYVETKKIDLFMTPHNEEELLIETLEKIKSHGIPTLLICFDNLIVPFVHYKIAPHFDLVWLTSKETKPLFDKLGANSVFLPYAANPNMERCDESVTGVGFVGTPYGSRANMINALTDNKISVYCHCLKKQEETTQENDPKPSSTMSQRRVGLEFIKFPQGRRVIEGAVVNRFKKSAVLNENEYLQKCYVVPPSKLYRVYPKYSLALSSTAARNTGVLKHPLYIVNLRSFEIPMSGGLQICQYTDEMAGYFEDGKEIIFYRTNEELVEKASFYCSPQQEKIRRIMREAAREKAAAHHTWFNRFSVVFHMLNIKA